MAGAKAPPSRVGAFGGGESQATLAGAGAKSGAGGAGAAVTRRTRGQPRGQRVGRGRGGVPGGWVGRRQAGPRYWAQAALTCRPPIFFRIDASLPRDSHRLTPSTSPPLLKAHPYDDPSR